MSAGVAGAIDRSPDSCSATLDGGRSGIVITYLTPIKLKGVLELREERRRNLAFFQKPGNDGARYRRRRVDTVVKDPKVTSDAIMERVDGGTQVMRVKPTGAPVRKQRFETLELAPQLAIVCGTREPAEKLGLTTRDWLHNCVAV
jgi:hypothetical protein